MVMGSGHVLGLRGWMRRLVAPASGLLLLGALLVGIGYGAIGSRAAPAAGRSADRSVATIQDMHALFFVWASGAAAVQRMAARDCAQLQFSAVQCSSVSDAVRAAWLDLAGQDPAAVGRLAVAPNLSGRAQSLTALTNSLSNATGGHTAALLAATASTYAQINQPQWIRDNVANAQTLAPGTVLVWATSYSQSSLPNGLKTRRSPYAAVPDAYIKYANWGNISSIPSIYQPYYAPSGSATHWVVNIANANATASVSNVLITDVGPWNEDDNWWDANGTSTQFPSSCPVAASTSWVASDATSNALIDGICPNGANLRRIYYYLFYQHYGLPFFQSGGYRPTGSFTDGTAWPIALPQECSEAAAASKNNDGINCSSGSGYNNYNGGWLRNNTYNSPVLNQSSIDVSPAVDKALGWVYPSSGLVQVTVSALP
jgi:hypothetical protein